MLASALELVDFWGRALAQTLGQDSSALPEPIAITRPGQQIEEDASESRVATPDEIAAWYSRNFAGRMN